MTTYEDVNEAWRPALPLPPVTAKDAAKIYLKLRRAFGTPYRGRGNITPRRVWAAPKGSNSALGNGLHRIACSAFCIRPSRHIARRMPSSNTR